MQDEGLKVAANWWADKLRSCRHSGLSAEERRDPANHGYQMAEMLMTLNKPKVTDEQVTLFVDTLFSRIKHDKTRWLDVDYGPCVELADALLAVGVDPGMGTLPIKTSMWIGDDKISVRYGYGEDEQQIWPLERGSQGGSHTK